MGLERERKNREYEEFISGYGLGDGLRLENCSGVQRKLGAYELLILLAAKKTKLVREQVRFEDFHAGVKSIQPSKDLVYSRASVLEVMSRASYYLAQLNLNERSYNTIVDKINSALSPDMLEPDILRKEFGERRLKAKVRVENESKG